MLLTFHAYAINSTLSEKYPHVLLTQGDYGILNEKDLIVEGRPSSFLPQKSLGELYWQCFPTQAISTQLDDKGYSSFDLDEHDGVLQLVADYQGRMHIYIMHRNWPLKGCEKRLKEWTKLMKHQKHACILGRYSHQIESTHGAEKYVWVFESLKTRRGEESYSFQPPHA